MWHSGPDGVTQFDVNSQVVLEISEVISSVSDIPELDLQATVDGMGYDPALFYDRVDHPDLGVLRLTPWRVQIDTTPGDTIIWEGE